MRSLLLVSLLLVPQLGKAAELELETDRVVVFKDGYALFVKTARGVADADGRLHTHQVPDGAILGSFWAYSDGRPALAMRAEWIETKNETTEQKTASSIAELLRANLKKRARLTFLRDDAQLLEGTILEVLADQLVLIENERGRSAIPIGDIRSLSGPGLETTLTQKISTPTKKKRLTFDLGREARGERVEIRLLYFTEGVRWIPTYRLGGELIKNGELHLQGELINEAEDIDQADLDLVVGVPSFRFKSTPSPLALETVLRSALASAAPVLMGQSIGNFSNASFNLRSREWTNPTDRETDPHAEGVTTLAPELASSTGEQDLFVYHAKKTSLAKGARLTLPLFAQKISLRHLYTVDLALSDNTDRAEVWHRLELTNPGDTPWTTGPIMLLRGLLPLGQDLLHYTAKKGRTEVPVTIATDVRATTKHLELDRKPNAYVWNRHPYAELRNKHILSLTNDRPETITLRVKATVAGRTEKASHNGKHRHLPANTINPQSEVTWEVNLEPGETRNLTVEAINYAA